MPRAVLARVALVCHRPIVRKASPGSSPHLSPAVCPCALRCVPLPLVRTGKDVTVKIMKKKPKKGKADAKPQVGTQRSYCHTQSYRRCSLLLGPYWIA